MGEIQRFVPTASPLDKIGEALKIAHEYYGIKSASQAQDLLDQQKDPDSTQSKVARADASALLSTLQKKGNDVSGIQEILKSNPSAFQLQGFKDSDLVNLTKAQMMAEATANKMAPFVQIKKDALEETKSQHASDVGKQFESDPIIKTSKQTTNSLDRALAIGNGKEPITASMFNVLQQDMINAMAPGGAATEGKVSREMIEPFAARLNELQSKFGNVSDLRTDPNARPILDNILAQARAVRGEFQDAMGRQALDIFNNYANTSNQKVKKTALDKLQRYNPKAWSELTGNDVTEIQNDPSMASANIPKSSQDSGGLGAGQSLDGINHIPMDAIHAEIAKRKARK